MAKKLLNASQEQWLLNNYHMKSNKELAETLTQMVVKENQKRIERLEKLVPEITHLPTRNRIEYELKQMKAFRGFTEAYVRHVGRHIGCKPKSKALISEYGKQKAHETNIKKWLKKARKVENMAIYIRNMRVREVRICIIEDEAHLKAFRNAIYKFNQTEGIELGIEIYNEFIKEVSLLRLEAKLNLKS